MSETLQDNDGQYIIYTDYFPANEKAGDKVVIVFKDGKTWEIFSDDTNLIVASIEEVERLKKGDRARDIWPESWRNWEEEE